MILDEKQEKALVEALSTLGALKSAELWFVSQDTIDGLESILGYTPETRKKDDNIVKVPSDKESGTFSDSYIN